MLRTIRSQSIAFVTLLIAVSVGVVSVVQITGLITALEKTNDTVLGVTDRLAQAADSTAQTFSDLLITSLDNQGGSTSAIIGDMSNDLVLSLEGQFSARLEVISALAPSALGPAIWDYDIDTVDTVLASLVALGAVEKVEVIEQSGSVLTSSGEVTGKSVQSRDIALAFDGNDLGTLRVHYSTEALDAGRAKIAERLSSIEQTISDVTAAAVSATEASRDRQVELTRATETEAVEAISRLSANAQADASVSALSTAVIAILLATAVVYFAMTALLFRPLKVVEGRMASLAEGELDSEVPFIGRRNEVGAMADALEVFRNNAHEKVALEEKQIRDAEEAARQKREAMDELACDFEASVGQIVESVSTASHELNGVAQSMLSTSDLTSDLSGSAKNSAQTAADSVNSVASAAEELSVSLGDTSQNMVSQKTAADDAVRLVEESGTQIRGLVEKAQQIGGVVEMITAIAEQTNLLALNATIESARAGEAGRGFAVVASEVKTLATQTATATESIRAEIEGIQSQTASAVDAIEMITKQMDAIKEISTSVAAMVEEQSATAGEIGRSTQDAADGTTRSSEAIVNVAQATEQTGEGAREVLSSAERLAEGSSRLQSEVANFLARVRAA